MIELTKTTFPKNQLWFQHQSPRLLHELKPLTYSELAKTRPHYDIDARKNTEQQYHKILKTNSKSSFLYATVVGYNFMDSWNNYPGYSYYFQLTNDQLQRCGFGLVDKKCWIDVQPGLINLFKCLTIWNSNVNNFVSYYEKGIGTIDPRIEIVIPFVAKPQYFIPQIEDR